MSKADTERRSVTDFMAIVAYVLFVAASVFLVATASAWLLAKAIA